MQSCSTVITMSAQSSTPVLALQSVPSRFAKLAAYYKSTIDKNIKIDPLGPVNNFHTFIVFPIKTICGINVSVGLDTWIDCFVHKNHNQCIRFEINSSRSVETNNGDGEMCLMMVNYFLPTETVKNRVITLAQYEEMLEQIYTLLPTLTFNRHINRFVNDSCPSPCEEMTFFFDHPNMESKVCPCCREVSMGMNTVCKHIICYPCFDQIPPVHDEDVGDEDG